MFKRPRTVLTYGIFSSMRPIDPIVSTVLALKPYVPVAIEILSPDDRLPS